MSPLPFFTVANNMVIFRNLLNCGLKNGLNFNFANNMIICTILFETKYEDIDILDYFGRFVGDGQYFNFAIEMVLISTWQQMGPSLQLCSEYVHRFNFDKVMAITSTFLSIMTSWPIIAFLIDMISFQDASWEIRINGGLK